MGCRSAGLRCKRAQRPELSQIAPLGLRVHCCESLARLFRLLLLQVRNAQKHARAARILQLADSLARAVLMILRCPTRQDVVPILLLGVITQQRFPGNAAIFSSSPSL